jgi:hypothetical protein
VIKTFLLITLLFGVLLSGSVSAEDQEFKADPGLLKLLAESPRISDALGDGDSADNGLDIWYARTAVFGRFLAVQVVYTSAVKEKSKDTQNFQFRDKGLGRNWFIQWTDAVSAEVTVWDDDKLPVRQGPSDGYRRYITENGYIFLIPLSQFSTATVLYLKYYSGIKDSNDRELISDTISGIRMVLPQAGGIMPPESDFGDLWNTARPLDSVSDPEGDIDPVKPSYDIKSASWRIQGSLFLLRAAYYNAKPGNFGWHTIAVKAPALDRNWWVQWYEFGWFEVWTFKTGETAEKMTVRKSRFDLIKVNPGDQNSDILFITDLGALLSGVPLGTELELKYYTGGSQASGEANTQADRSDPVYFRYR